MSVMLAGRQGQEKATHAFPQLMECLVSRGYHAAVKVTAELAL